MDWKMLPPTELHLLVRAAVDYLNRSGVVHDAYYRIHDNYYPVVYARMNVKPLKDVPVVLHDDAVTRVLETMGLL